MKYAPLILGSAIIFNVSCGKNTPGMGNANSETKKNLKKNMNVSVSVQDVNPAEQGDDYYGPILLPHDAELKGLFASLHKGIPEVKSEDIAEGENRSSILVGEILLYPYLDEMVLDTKGVKFFLSKIILEDGKEWIILHQGGNTTDVNVIVDFGFPEFLQLLQAGKTVTYHTVPEEDNFRYFGGVE